MVLEFRVSRNDAIAALRVLAHAPTHNLDEQRAVMSFIDALDSAVFGYDESGRGE